MLERTLAAPVGKAMADKTRSMGKVTGELFAGDVEGRTAIVFDDMISTGGTMVRAAAACRARGAAEVLAVATHGLFVDANQALFNEEAIDEVWITDSLPLPLFVANARSPGRIQVVTIADLLAEAIRRFHSGGSINELLKHPDVAH